jgi:hypothetical protein
MAIILVNFNKKSDLNPKTSDEGFRGGIKSVSCYIRMIIFRV